MINQTRVRRIKNMIYFLIVMLFLVPAILLIVLGVRMLRSMSAIDEKILELDQIIQEHSLEGAQAYPPPAPADTPPESQYPVPQAADGSVAPSDTPADAQYPGGSEAPSPAPVIEPPPTAPADVPLEPSTAPEAGGEGSAAPEHSLSGALQPEGQASGVTEGQGGAPPSGSRPAPDTGVRAWWLK